MAVSIQSRRPNGVTTDSEGSNNAFGVQFCLALVRQTVAACFLGRKSPSGAHEQSPGSNNDDDDDDNLNNKNNGSKRIRVKSLTLVLKF